MKVKAAFFVALLAISLVDNSDAWFGLIATAVKGLLSWTTGDVSLQDLKEWRDMDEHSYEALTSILESNLSDEFDDDQARNLLSLMDYIRRLSDDDFKNLVDSSPEYDSDNVKEAPAGTAYNALVDRLKAQRRDD